MYGMYGWLRMQKRLHKAGSLRSDRFGALVSIGVFTNGESIGDSSTLVSPSTVSNGSLRLTGTKGRAERSSQLANSVSYDDHSEGTDTNDRSCQADSVAHHDHSEGTDADDHSCQADSVSYDDSGEGMYI